MTIMTAIDPGDEGEGDDLGRDTGESLSALNLPEGDLDHCYRLLAAPERRYLLGYLAAAGDERVDLDALARYVATHCSGSDRAIRLQLRHSHLPQFEVVDALTFDPADDTVRYSTHPLLETLLDVAATASHTAYRPEESGSETDST